MTAPGDTQLEDVLVIRGRILSRTGQARFRQIVFHFAELNRDDATKVTRLPEAITVPMDQTGLFEVAINPSTNGGGFIIKAVLTTFSGEIFTDFRTLPATGTVDYFQCPRATSLDNIRWPNGETPVLVSDYNKPGGPLQLTDEGTIDDSHIPPDFLRIDDPRLEDIGLNLSNYVTKVYYEADQLARRSITIPFTNLDVWEYTHNMGYRPLVACIDQGGDEVHGAVTYPDTATVRVEWDAPTSGTMIVR
ncbi:hypothetical protein BH789_gp102 [Gordonia phage GMA6]|uniref:Uncharacterized protein n=1 Tax=Gordonia phage GMA6 TaxID=1647285 RepID=A0A0K0NLB9_9CAUD|nr:hypothetical protein BH789_gp102 [Gordonia phage GMA6]AKL88383.1 hypothetical protein GMA6_102 [Gordonia phage GMA6]